MKNLFLLFAVAISFISCSNDESPIIQQPTPRLEKVIVFKNTNQEQTWNFNSIGQLYECLNAAGQRLESYTYNDKNQVTSWSKYTNGVVTSSYTFGYNTSGMLTKINNDGISIIASTGAYTYTSNGITREVSFDTNKNANFVKETNSTSTVNYQMIYNSGNLVSFTRTSATANLTKNYTYNTSTTYKTNLGLMIAPVALVKSFLEPEFLSNGFTSISVPESSQNGNPATLRYEYGAIPFDRSMLFIGEEFVNNNPGNLTSYQEYYYAN
ncbi:MAG: hypothetical protein RL607_2164 [Bacteroidota bacterium]|jgi:hypothetical protein